MSSSAGEDAGMNAPQKARPVDDRPSAEQTDAVLRASRALVGIAATSLTAVEDVVTVPQWRVLVLIFTRGPMNLASVAAELDVNPSNASRTCDRLTKAGLLDRHFDVDHGWAAVGAKSDASTSGGHREGAAPYARPSAGGFGRRARGVLGGGGGAQ